MSEIKLTPNQMKSFRQYLIREEKSTATVEKYLRDARAFAVYMDGADVTKDAVLLYKKQLIENG